MLRMPAADELFNRVRYYVEEDPVAEYCHASAAAYEAFRDLKFGIRIHWGPYAIQQVEASWPLISGYNDAQRQAYQELYRQFNPRHFDADQWMRQFADWGAKMFCFTTKHTDGFSMYDTKTRVKRRVNWIAPGGLVLEDCDVAYSIMESPFRRDVVEELCEAARRHRLKVDLYYGHPDWYDADLRNFALHPVQTPEYRDHPERYGNGTGTVEPAVMSAADPTDAEIARGMRRYRDQLTELLTGYGPVDMVCFDMLLGPKAWPHLREILIDARKLQPDVMFRARGIGNYGDYHTPEDVVPGVHDVNGKPWFVIHRLAGQFSYDPDSAKHRDAHWIIHTLADIVAKGGNFMVAVGPDADGLFHPTAITALKETGDWLRVNGEAIYGTRPRQADRWRDGSRVLYTQSKDQRTIYAINLYWPGPTLRLYTVSARPGSTIRMLGVDTPLTWRHNGHMLEIDVPAALQDESRRPCRHAWTFQIESAV